MVHKDGHRAVTVVERSNSVRNTAENAIAWKGIASGYNGRKSNVRLEREQVGIDS
jgi:hypothetical protein